jgi:hypothetical protein
MLAKVSRYSHTIGGETTDSKQERTNYLQASKTFATNNEKEKFK